MNRSSAFSPHRNFADNLRALCARHGSIAAVCSAMGMNRQQFNKYLAGSTLPNAPALERICSFFGVLPESLFLAPATDPTPRLPEAASAALLRMRASTLRPGCYHFYTPWPGGPQKCVRSALFVYRHDGLTLFSRFTKLRQPGLRQRYFLSGRHDGVVLESDKAKFLLSTSRKGYGEASLVSIGAESALSPDFLSGLALVVDAAGRPLSVRATLEYRGASNLLRRTIAEACMLPLLDPSIPEDVRQSMSAQTAEPCLSPFSLLDSMPQPLRRGS